MKEYRGSVCFHGCPRAGGVAVPFIRDGTQLYLQRVERYDRRRVCLHLTSLTKGRARL
jgi:hypothetical protein